jgi:hypothetical protein
VLPAPINAIFGTIVSFPCSVLALETHSLTCGTLPSEMGTLSLPYA